MTAREIIDAINALTEVIKLNDNPQGNVKLIGDANEKIIKLIGLL